MSTSAELVSHHPGGIEGARRTLNAVYTAFLSVLILSIDGGRGAAEIERNRRQRREENATRIAMIGYPFAS
jgi:hypothetical protein